MRKYLPPITVLLFRNSENFANINASESNKIGKTAKIST